MVRKMKDSGVEWIGEIPEDWDVSKLKFSAQIISGSTPNSNEPAYWNGDIIWITPKDLYDNQIISSSLRTITKEGYLSCGTTLVPKNSVILSTRAPIGAVGIAGKELCTNQGIKSMLCKEGELHYKYLYYYLLINDLVLNSLGNGTTFLELSTTGLENLEIPCPSFEEQCRVVEALDVKNSSLDNIRGLLLDEIQTLEAYKKSVITEAVTKGLDKNAEMKDSGIEWIGEIPKHWHLVKLKFLTETIAKGISPNYTEEELSPVVNQASFSKGYFDYNLKYCSDELKGEGLLKKNDVLLATTGGGVLGKTFYFQENGKYLASTDVAYLRCKSKEASKFIYYILSVNYDLLNGEFAKGSTNQTHLQMDRLNNMEIPWPVDNELKDILTKIDHSSETIEEVIAIKQNQLSLLDEYKKSLIYEYVTGKREV